MIDLVLVPGHLCDGAMWERQIAALGDIARPVVADTLSDESMSGMASRILANAPQRFALAGLSMGGMIGFEVMRQAPERVERLALLDTNHLADLPERIGQRQAMIDRFDAGGADDVVEEFLGLLVPPSRFHEAGLMDPMRAMMRRTARKALPAQVKALLGRPDSRADLPNYELPVTLVCGREDQLTPLALHEDMAGLIPGAYLEVIEDCAHMSTMEKPEQVNAILRSWLLEG